MKPVTLLATLATFAAGLGVGLWLAAHPDPSPEEAPTAPLHASPSTSRANDHAPSPLVTPPAPARLRDPLHALQLTARLADRATNAPLADADLALVEPAPPPREAAPDAPPALEARRLTEFGRARSTPDGRVTLTITNAPRDLAALPLALALEAPGHVARMQTFELDTSRTDLGFLFLDAEPSPGVVLTGSVRNGNRGPAGDALLLLGSDPLYPLADARPVGRTSAAGELELDALVQLSDRHVVQQLFALTEDGLAWTEVRIAAAARELDLGVLRPAPTQRVVVRVVDESGRPVGAAPVEARARFYPLAGLFDADEPGFTPDARVLALFQARTDAFGHAWFEHLPAPHASGIYEFVSSVPELGRGTALLERSGEAAEASVTITLGSLR
ncbi:MAG: hypothetical protein IPJ77_09270 [Planctomycetes bacterium]|nr:hypothetical protein [Planctomycetota bacterium]